MPAAVGHHLRSEWLVSLKPVGCPVSKKRKRSANRRRIWLSESIYTVNSSGFPICMGLRTIYMYLLLYIGTAFNWEYFLFLNPGYFAMFAGDTSNICDLARSKASWGLKGFTTPQNPTSQSHFIWHSCRSTGFQMGLHLLLLARLLHLSKSGLIHDWISFWMKGSWRETEGLQKMVWAAFCAQFVALTGADALCILP